MAVSCANCGIQFAWQPTVVDGRSYCCIGCAMGGPCSCDYSNLPNDTECRMIMVITKAREIIPFPSQEDPGPQ